jgi:hypothetical protein
VALALLPLGESWHNGHHSEPSCARHGLDRGQIAPSAAVIGLFERLGWAGNVHWPDHDRIQRRRAGPPSQARARPDTDRCPSHRRFPQWLLTGVALVVVKKPLGGGSPKAR